MFNHQNNRVLVRRGARVLSMEEAERVGAAQTTSGCVITGGIHGTATDTYCEDCPDC
jgi:hypothetical protein